MKLFKGLALFAALAEAQDDSCPNDRWKKEGEACVPGEKWTTTCNGDGTLTINAHIDHFYAAVPSTLKTLLITDLINNDFWFEGADDVLEKTVPLSFSQVDVDGTSYIRGQYTFGPGPDAISAARPTVNSVGLEIATPLSYTVTCDYASSIAVKISEVGIDANPTFSGGSSTTGSLDIGATLTGADDSSKKWTIGDTVTLTVTDKLVNSLDVSVAIESCTAYSDKDYLKNAVPISKGTCYENQINTQIVTQSDFFYVSAISWDAFKYSSGDEAAYVKCQLRACIFKDGARDTACAAAVSANDNQARDAGDLTCLR